MSPKLDVSILIALIGILIAILSKYSQDMKSARQEERRTQEIEKALAILRQEFKDFAGNVREKLDLLMRKL